MDLALVLEQPHSHRVNRSVSPSLVIESACGFESIYPLGVGLSSVKVHVSNLKVGPEVACGVSVGLLGVGRVLHGVCEPLERAVRVHVLRVLLDKVHGHGPQGFHGERVVVQRDGESVRFVVVLHELENIVVDRAVVVRVGLESPVPLELLKTFQSVEPATVEPTHVVVALHVCVLNPVVLEPLNSALFLFRVDVGRFTPDLLRNDLKEHLARTVSSDGVFELGRELLVTDERVRVVEMVVPSRLDLSDRMDNCTQLLVSHKRQKRGISTRILVFAQHSLQSALVVDLVSMFSSTISSLVSLAPATSYSRTFMISSIDSFPSWSASASPSLCPPLAVPISFSLNLSPYLLTLDEYLFSLLMRSTFGCSTWGFSGVDPRVDARNRTTTTAAAIKYLVDL